MKNSINQEWISFIPHRISHKDKRKEYPMKRVYGLMLFCFSCGMVTLLFIPVTLTTLIFIIACLIVGYNLFCC